ncbi:hypothetical protein D1007_01035 [Hordeum vulgare]|nr:hypothetical protein D1007_01035 [Hordeum vulgare]
MPREGCGAKGLASSSRRISTQPLHGGAEDEARRWRALADAAGRRIFPHASCGKLLKHARGRGREINQNPSLKNSIREAPRRGVQSDGEAYMGGHTPGSGKKRGEWDSGYLHYLLTLGSGPGCCTTTVMCCESLSGFCSMKQRTTMTMLQGLGPSGACGDEEKAGTREVPYPSSRGLRL